MKVAISNFDKSKVGSNLSGPIYNPDQTEAYCPPKTLGDMGYFLSKEEGMLAVSSPSEHDHDLVVGKD